jgi:hypothetical protein
VGILSLVLLFDRPDLADKQILARWKTASFCRLGILIQRSENGPAFPKAATEWPEYSIRRTVRSGKDGRSDSGHVRIRE